MSPQCRTPRFNRLGRACLGIVWLHAALPVQAQPHALDPLPPPMFSVDRASPLNILIPGAAAGILQKPGPTLCYPGPGMGLISINDDLDALSFNRLPAVSQKDYFLFLLGVDRESMGGVLADSTLALAGRPYNVTDQADRGQAAADLYLSLGAFTPDGAVTPKGKSGRPAGNNVLAVNQGDTGGVDDDLSPEKNPIQRVADSESIDALDSASYSSSAKKSRDGSRLVERIYFSVTSDSPSLPFLPGETGMQSGADVFADPDARIGGNEVLYASAEALGLQGPPTSDDIDAMVVLDNGNGTLNPGIDRIYFSLARGSPSLAVYGFSPADVLMSRGYGSPPTLFASAEELGLNPVLDNLTSLEVWPFDGSPGQEIYNRAIFRVWPGDYNDDGMLTQPDCDMFEDCYSGPTVPYDTDGGMVHTVFVGPGPVFTPRVLMDVEVGDVVRWVWMEGGHNVVSGENCTPDGAFSSGPPSTSGSTFEVLFGPALLNASPVPGAVYHYCSQPDSTIGMTGEIHVVPDPCAVFDLDFDNDVDGADWAEFQPVYIEATGGSLCLLTISEFVDALLGCPQKPAHTYMADFNGDHTANGLDVQGYVEAYLGM